MDKIITILNFSGRNDGNCEQICKFIEHFHANTNICVINIKDHFDTCKNCNYQCLRPEQVCPKLGAEQRTVMDRLMESHRIYYVVPNYCGWPSANYFAFNERTVGYFNGDRSKMKSYMQIDKRFIVVSNSETEMFRQAMSQQTTEPLNILYMKTSKYTRQSIAGNMLDFEEAKNDLLKYLHENKLV